MTVATPTFSLLTKVLDPRHCVILRDWLEFLTLVPTEMVIYCPPSAAIQREVEGVCQQFQISWKTSAALPTDDLKHNETAILSRMVEEATGEYLLFVNLDTLPYRSDASESAWLQEVFDRLRGDDRLMFFSGCGFTFRGDELEASGRYFRTQRFSNNFGLVRKSLWKTTVAAHRLEPTPAKRVHRYHSEWAIEEEARMKHLFGLRRVDTPGWRVFHVQQWDHRLFETRELFRRGVGISRYLNRVHEDCLLSFDYYYNYPKPPFLRRLKVWAGRVRRAIGNFFLGQRRMVVKSP